MASLPFHFLLTLKVVCACLGFSVSMFSTHEILLSSMSAKAKRVDLYPKSVPFIFVSQFSKTLLDFLCTGLAVSCGDANTVGISFY